MEAQPVVMDLFTHFVIPYALFALLRRPQVERLAAGLGGWAPDFDTLIGWLDRIHPSLYFLGHRGLSHSLLGAPLFAVAVLALVSLPPWHRRWPRMAAWRFTPRTVLIAAAASYTHLILDFLTIWGIPTLYPWSLERFSLNWFFYSVTGAFFVSGYLCWRLARGTLTDKVLWRGMAVLVAVMVVSGVVRYATHPGLPHGPHVQPGSSEWKWTTYTRNETGWEVGYWSWGSLTHTRFYNETLPATAEAEAALARARDTLEYRDFRLFSWGPEAVLVEPAGPGAWNVTILDLTRRASIDDAPGWFPRFADYGSVRFHVDAEGVRRR